MIWFYTNEIFMIKWYDKNISSMVFFVTLCYYLSNKFWDKGKVWYKTIILHIFLIHQNYDSFFQTQGHQWLGLWPIYTRCYPRISSKAKWAAVIKPVLRLGKLISTAEAGLEMSINSFLNYFELASYMDNSRFK